MDQEEVRDICAPSLLAKQPLVSVHMLAYRHERFLARAIEGVVMQICDFPFELVIAEDCSPDKTLDIAIQYQEKYPDLIRIIAGKVNIGMRRNSRRNMDFCRGKYIASCEGDDFWHRSDKLKMQIDLMEANPDMVLCHTDFDRRTRFFLRKNRHKCDHNQPAVGDAYLSLLYAWSVMTATSVYRKDIIFKFYDSAFFDLSIPFSDRSLLLFASLHGKIGYLDVSTATFTKRRGSATNSGDDAALKMFIATEKVINDFMRYRPVSREDTLRITSEIKRQLCLRAYHAGNVDLALSSLDWLHQNKQIQSRFPYTILRIFIKARLPYRLIKTYRYFVNVLSCSPS
jgi:glycosyltransferase involved in cell wall biosynthesis